MGLFRVPPETRFDLHLSVFGIPMRVHPLFWLIVFLFGTGTESVGEMLIWIVVVFFSITIHEAGHSLMMRRYKVDSYIVLYGFGGLAVPIDPLKRGNRDYISLSHQQRILVSFAGPLAGFLIAGLLVGLTIIIGGQVVPDFIAGFIPLPWLYVPFHSWGIELAMGMLMWVNVFWGVINLTPVYPLDGGQISMNLFMLFNKVDGEVQALWLSAFSGALMAVIGYVYMDSLYIAILFGLLAFRSFEMASSFQRY